MSRAGTDAVGDAYQLMPTNGQLRITLPLRYAFGAPSTGCVVREGAEL